LLPGRPWSTRPFAIDGDAEPSCELLRILVADALVKKKFNNVLCGYPEMIERLVFSTDLPVSQCEVVLEQATLQSWDWTQGQNRIKTGLQAIHWYDPPPFGDGTRVPNEYLQILTLGSTLCCVVCKLDL